MMKEDENNQNEENNICGTYKYNKDINESLDNSSFLPGILKRSLSEDEKSIKKIIRFKSEDFNMSFGVISRLNLPICWG